MGRIRERREWKRIGRIEKSVIPILLIQLMTICHLLSNFYPLCSTSLFVIRSTQFELVTILLPVEHLSSVSSQLVVIRSVEFEKRCTIFANYSALPCVTLGGCPRFELSGKSGWLLPILILFGVVGFNSFGLDDDGGVAAGDGAAFGGDGAGDVAGRQSERHGDGGSDRQRQVFDGFHKPLFLSVS